MLSFAYLLWWGNPLLWWKVHHSPHSLFSFSLLLICLCRFMHTNFWPLLVSLGTTSLFQEPLFWSSDCFLSLSIFEQTCAHRWRLQLFRRQCTLGNGFGRTLWSGIRRSVLFFTVPNLLFINCLKLFKLFCLLFLFIYVQKLNINKTVGALRKWLHLR